MQFLFWPNQGHKVSSQECGKLQANRQSKGIMEAPYADLRSEISYLSIYILTK